MTELTKQFAHPTEIDVTLRGVTASCVDLIDGVESADVLLVAGADLFRSIAATSTLAVEIVCGPVLASGLVDGGGDEVAVVRATRSGRFRHRR
jgi:hypothetical protein